MNVMLCPPPSPFLSPQRGEAVGFFLLDKFEIGVVD
jgi:hypothetical protein